MDDRKAWIVTVNMGYGHQRTTYALRNLAHKDLIINANDYDDIPKKDKGIWESSRSFYEFISNFKRIPFIGNLVFSIYDTFQRIFTFYPRRDLSFPNLALKVMFSLIEEGWGRDLIQRLNRENGRRPLISAFFTPAFMAEYFKYEGDIYCIVCDADIARSWVPLNPFKSHIKYFAPNTRTVERLKMYGISSKNIFLTGYPLPLENIGGEDMEILKEDLRNRLINLDPEKNYFKSYEPLIRAKLGKLPSNSNHPLTILFSVGGAGVQKELSVAITNNLKEELKREKLKIILSAGIKEKVNNYFLRSLERLKLSDLVGKSIEIIFEKEMKDYFRVFNEKLRVTDILWTKPSELSFYSALGIPLVIAPPVGSQEEFNRRWLLKSGFGMEQESIYNVKEWFYDWLKRGFFAEKAMQALIKGRQLGALNIEKVIFNNR